MISELWVSYANIRGPDQSWQKNSQVGNIMWMSRMIDGNGNLTGIFKSKSSFKTQFQCSLDWALRAFSRRVAGTGQCCRKIHHFTGYIHAIILNEAAAAQ
jgi:hypothetical protein